MFIISDNLNSLSLHYPWSCLLVEFYVYFRSNDGGLGLGCTKPDPVSVTVVGGEMEQLLEAAGAAAEEADIVRHATDTHTDGAHPVAEAVVSNLLKHLKISITMLSRRGRPPKLKKKSPIIDGA